MRKKCSSDREEILKFEANGRGFAKIFRSPEPIYLNSESSEEF